MFAAPVELLNKARKPSAVLPEAVVKKLGLVSTGKVRVRYADGRTAKRERVQYVYLEALGRNSVFSATVEPKPLGFEEKVVKPLADFIGLRTHLSRSVFALLFLFGFAGFAWNSFQN